MSAAAETTHVCLTQAISGVSPSSPELEPTSCFISSVFNPLTAPVLTHTHRPTHTHSQTPTHTLTPTDRHTHSQTQTHTHPHFLPLFGSTRQATKTESKYFGK